MSTSKVTILQMHLQKKVLMMLHCLDSPPVHHWYQGSRPGGCLSIDCNRRYQTTLTRFLSGNIRSLTSSDNSKCFEIPQNVLQNRPHLIMFFHAWGFPNRILFLILY
ncbi:hypothetical protein AVEN_138798-1 [Araneus ventricosus]|uniref:Uncharacterized protein n=1 Tax=Araneus ventricosus TaxID=182803 RepID=A0A4Y2NZS8_ARAVE|nr:hypothetical protein AVEN_138798-1 [Araneus ventricosus]